MLLYDSQSFAVLNNTESAANVAEVVFVGAQTSFAVARWDTQWLSGSLTALGANDCLETWSWDIKSTLSKPSACRQRRGVITIASNQLFWNSRRLRGQAARRAAGDLFGERQPLRLRSALGQQ